SVSARSCIARPDSQRRPAAGRGSPFFFCDVLEHLLVQEQLGDEPLEAIDLELQLSAPAIRVDLLRVVLLSPPVIGRLGYADLSTDVRDCQSLGQIAVCLAQQPRHFLGGPSPSHGSLRESVYPETPISAGSVFGEQTSSSRQCIAPLCQKRDQVREPSWMWCKDLVQRVCQ